MTLEEQIKALLEAKEKDDEKNQDQADRVDAEPAVKIENPMTPGMQSSEVSPQGEIAAADEQGEEDEKEEDEKEKVAESTIVAQGKTLSEATVYLHKAFPGVHDKVVGELKKQHGDSNVKHDGLHGDFHKYTVSGPTGDHASVKRTVAGIDADSRPAHKDFEHHGVSVQESISDLLGDEFSEEFKLKAQTIFEAAVKEQVTKYKAELQEEHNAAVAKLEEKFEEKFLTRSKHLQEETSDKIDGYLNFLAEEWKKENQVALEAAIKSDLTESFISNLKTLFEQHYVDLPEERVDVYAKVVEEKSQMESALATTVSKLKTLTEELHQIKRDQIIEESAKDFSSMDRARFKTLTEDFAFEDASSFKTKVGIVKKSFFGQKSIAKEQLTEELVKNEPIVESSEPVQIVENTVMSAYLKALPKKK